MADTPLSLWLPGEAARGAIEEREGVKEAERVFGDFAKRLRAIDSRFRLYLHSDGAESFDHGMRPGFYYLLRANEDGTFAAYEVRNPDGSFREPDDAILEAVRQMDPNRVRDAKWERQKARRMAERAREQKRRFDAEERQARLLELAESKFRLQIPVGDALGKFKDRKDAA